MIYFILILLSFLAGALYSNDIIPFLQKAERKVLDAWNKRAEK